MSDPSAAPRPGADLLEAFRQFPTASALLLRDGAIALANKRFASRFGPDGLALECRLAAVASARARPEGWCDVLLETAAGVIAGRALALTNRVLLVIDEPGEDPATR